MNLRELRNSYGLTQAKAALSIGVPLRTYIRYETKNDSNNIKYQSMCDILKEQYEITETNGVYSLDKIKELVKLVLDNYPGQIEFCYIFGSYSKGYATENSDIDLCVDTTLTGYDFVGLVEEMRQVLKKEVDLIRFTNLKDNLELVKEIMKDGIKIYG